MNTIEKRLIKRINFQKKCFIEKRGVRNLCNFRDVSADGKGISFSSEIFYGLHEHLVLDIADTLNVKTDDAECVIRVLHCRQNGTTFNYGCAVIHANDEFAEFVNTLNNRRGNSRSRLFRELAAKS